MILPPLRAYLIPFAVLLLIIAMGRAGADVTTQQTKQGFCVNVTTCPDVRAVVKIVGEAEAEKAARAAGASEEAIARARRCLTRD